MSLSRFKVPTEQVEVSPGESFPVRGLSTRDIGLLAARHHAMLSALFAEVAAGRGEGSLSQGTVEQMLPDLLQKAPELVSDIIAVSYGDIEDSQYVSVMPLPVQVDALTKVFRLTFRTEGELKKVIETVIQGLSGTTRQLNSLSES